MDTHTRRCLNQELSDHRQPLQAKQQPGGSGSRKDPYTLEERKRRHLFPGLRISEKIWLQNSFAALPSVTSQQSQRSVRQVACSGFLKKKKGKELFFNVSGLAESGILKTWASLGSRWGPSPSQRDPRGSRCSFQDYTVFRRRKYAGTQLTAGKGSSASRENLSKDKSARWTKVNALSSA